MTRLFTEEWLANRERKAAQRIGKPTPAEKAQMADRWNGKALANCEVVDSLSGGVESRNLRGPKHGKSVARQTDCATARGPAEMQAPCNGAGVAPGPLTNNAGAAIRKEAESTPRPATPAPILERDVLPAVLQALKLHRRVAWVHRFNTGGMEGAYGNHVQFGFKGCSDILGQLKDGRLLAVEVKRPGGQPTQSQIEFLGLVDRSGGVSFIARSVDDVMAALELPKRAA